MYPNKGQKFTISTNKVTGDRSWIDKILVCEEHNSISIICKQKDPSPAYSGFIILLKSEHDFDIMPTQEFYAGQQVIMSDDQDFYNNNKQIYGYYKDGKHYNINGITWKYCKPDPNATTLPVWHKVVGKTIIKNTDKNIILYLFEDGDIGQSTAFQLLVNSTKVGKVISYCIVPLP